MRDMIIASTSTIHGTDYLSYLLPDIMEVFKKQGIKNLLFIPYARPGGISHETYTNKVKTAFKDTEIEVQGIHEFKNPKEAIENAKGEAEITVVNIHKFQNDDRVAAPTDYNLGIQRIYFLDEVHRSYNPKGSFLANLRESDPNSIKIGLTGTPLLGTDVNSKMLFGGYIHKYYYNQSIADNYTLRLIREEIETTYKVSLNKILAELQIKQGDADRKYIYSHTRFVEPMLDYTVKNLEEGRISLGHEKIGGMVICVRSDEAKEMQTTLKAK